MRFGFKEYYCSLMQNSLRARSDTNLKKMQILYPRTLIVKRSIKVGPIIDLISSSKSSLYKADRKYLAFGEAMLT